MKKVLSLFLLPMLFLSAAACAGGSGKNDSSTVTDGKAPTVSTVTTDKRDTTVQITGNAADTVQNDDAPTTPIGNIGVGVTCGDTSKFTDETIEILKKNNIQCVRVVFLYPFRDASGKTVSDSFSKARAAAIKLASAGFTVVGQTFWPGGMGADSSGQRTWLLHTGIPEAYARYDEDLTYDKMAEATRYIARSLKKYVEYWLVSNEPDIETYTGPMTDAQILRYINSCAKGIKEGNPNAKCGINLLGLVNPARSKLFVSRLYGNDSCLDWLGLDGYFGSLQAGGAETWDDYITQFHAIAKKPIIITEWSYPSPETDPLNTFPHRWEGHVRGKKAQADFVSACMKIFIKHEEVIGTLWYQLCDSDAVCWECGNPDCRLYSDWGILCEDLTGKPAMQAMAEASVAFQKARKKQ